MVRLSDIELLEATRSGEPEAFAVFYRRYREVVVAYFARRVRTAEVAADLMAEVFAAALSALHREAAVLPDQPASWLFGIAHHKLVDAYRAGAVETRARELLGFEPLVLDDHDIARIDALTDEHRVLELLDDLPGDQREAVRARVLHDRDYEAIAAEVGCSNLVVRKRVSRALRNLRTALQERT